MLSFRVLEILSVCFPLSFRSKILHAFLVFANLDTCTALYLFPAKLPQTGGWPLHSVLLTDSDQNKIYPTDFRRIKFWNA